MTILDEKHDQINPISINLHFSFVILPLKKSYPIKINFLRLMIFQHFFLCCSALSKIHTFFTIIHSLYKFNKFNPLEFCIKSILFFNNEDKNRNFNFFGGINYFLNFFNLKKLCYFDSLKLWLG